MDYFVNSVAQSAVIPAVVQPGSGVDPITFTNPVFQFIGNDIAQADGVNISGWATRVSPGAATFGIASGNGMQANTTILPGFKVAHRTNAGGSRQLSSTDSSAYLALSGDVSWSLYVYGMWDNVTTGVGLWWDFRDSVGGTLTRSSFPNVADATTGQSIASGTGGTIAYTRTPNVFQSHIWVHDTTGPTLTLYIDGVSVGSTAATGTGIANCDRLLLGTTNAGVQANLYTGAYGANQTIFTPTQAADVHAWLVDQYT